MRAPKVLQVKIRLSCKDMGVLLCFDEFCGAFEAGARMAEPGEFSPSFLNGRMDLTR